MDIVSEMARTGRHYNIALVLATQYGKDLMSGQGKTVLESCATKVVLHQDQVAIDVLGPAFNLSETEKRFVVNSRVGEGVPRLRTAIASSRTI